MARRNVLRSWTTASLLLLSGVPALVGAASPARAAEPVTVWVHPTHFQGPDPAAPSRIYAEPHQEIIFRLVDPADTHHTVTIMQADCQDKPRALCDKAFDDPSVRYPDPNNHTVAYRWSQEGEYEFFDRYAWMEERRAMTGVFIITHSPPAVQPSTPTSNTATTAPPTTVTTAPTTTTSAPTSIRPHLVPDPPSTTTTTAAPTPPTTANNRAPAPPPSAKKGNKDKDKSKPASTETTATTVPPPSDTAWIDSLLGTASLTPSPALLDQPAGDSADEVAIDAAEVASLLEKPASDGDDNKLLLIGLAAVAVLLLAVATSAWVTRSSRYDPA